MKGNFVLNNEIGAKVSHWLLPRLHALSARRKRRVCAGSLSLLAIVAAAIAGVHPFDEVMRGYRRAPRG